MLGLGILGAGSAARSVPPFEVETWDIAGRVIDAQVTRADGQSWIVAVSVEGMPPDETRRLTIGRLGEAPRILVLSARTLAFDIGDITPSPGPEILAITADALRVVTPDGRVLRTVALAPPLPFPPRTRQISRTPVLRDWDGLGRTEALLPDARGFRVVPLADPAAAHVLELDVLHEAEGAGIGALEPGPWRAQLTWPTAALADDDGDGIPEFHASDRFGLRVFRRGPGGLAARPEVRRRFPPFSFEEELRHVTNFLWARSPDLDGDGLADLVVHRTVGTLSGARAHAALYRNRGDGADPTAEPDAVLVTEGGFGDLRVEDLDADGSQELFETSVKFGLFQMIRIMTRGRADVGLALYEVSAAGDGLATHETWSATISVPFDTGKGRVGTLLPRTGGDWNGDGIRDLVYGEGDRLAVRLGERADDGLRFSDAIAIDVRPAEGGRTADLDGDGLDELMLWNPIAPGAGLRILRNRGQLPGSRPRLEPVD